MDIKVEKPTQEELAKLSIDSWDTWICGESKFNWEYTEEEICYFLEGKVIIETDKGEITVEKGDLVVFAKGLKCVWNVLEPVRKLYKFN